MNKISLAMPTWKAPKTLQHTLQNLEPILDFFDEKNHRLEMAGDAKGRLT